MAFNLGDIFVTFKARTEDLQNGVAKVKAITRDVQQTVNRSSFKQFASNASSAFAGVAGAIQNVATKALLLAGAGTLGIGRFVSLAGELQTTQQRMSALAGSTDKAQKIMGQLYNYVLGKPIEFPTASKAAATLLGYGVAAENVVDSMKTLSAFSIVNGADMGQLALAYGQVNAKGRLMGQEIIQLTNNFVPVSQVIAKHFNVSVQKAMELMDNGKITAAEFNQAMAEFIPQSEIAKQSNTFKNRMISLQGSIRAFGLALIGVKVDPQLGLVVKPGGLFDRISNFLPKLAKGLTELRPKFVAGFDFLVRNGDTIKTILIGLAAAFVAAKLAAIGFAIAAAANPATLIAAAIVALIGVLVALQSRFDWVGKAVAFVKPIFDLLVATFNQFVLPSLQALANMLITNLWPALQQIINSVTRLWNALNPALMTAIKIIAGILGGVFIAAVWLGINVLRVITKIISGVASVVSNLIKWVSNLIGWFGRLVSNAYGAGRSVASAFASLPGKIGTIIGKVVDWFKGLPGKVGGALKGIGSTLTSPFRTAFNAIAKLWNGTVGKLSFHLPKWVPGMGGKGFSMPQLPYLATGVENFAGGWAVVGERGPELTYLPKGSNVYSNDKSKAMGGRSTNIYGDINIASQSDADYLLKRLDRNLQLESRGGSPAYG